MIPAVVTNKHVLNNAVQVTLKFTLKDASGRPDINSHYSASYSNALRIDHPDSNVDLSILPLADLLHQLEMRNIHPAMFFVSASNIPSQLELEQLSPVEDIFTIGYPLGFIDTKHNRPLFRRGITSTSAGLPYCGNSEFLIDSAVYPGSSGSPVVIANSGSYNVDGGIVVGDRFLLLGVVNAVHMYGANGGTVVRKIGDAPSNLFVQTPSHLGVAVSAHRILDFKRKLQK